MKKLDGKINLNEEFSSLVDFLELRWETVPSLRALLHKAWDKGLEIFSDSFESGHVLSNKIVNMAEDKSSINVEALSQSEKDVVSRYHPCVIFNKGAFFAIHKKIVNQTLNIDYSYIEKALNVILKDYPECKKVKPFGWSAFKKSYTDFAGMNEYNEKADREVFNGTDVEPHERSFVLKVSLPQIMYDEVCQGNSRIMVLMVAVLEHARKCLSYNNMLDFLSEIKKVEEYFVSLNKCSPMPFNVSFEGVTENVLLNDILNDVRDDFLSEEDFKEKVKRKEDYDALPEEEKQKRKADNAAAIKAIFEKKINNS